MKLFSVASCACLLWFANVLTAQTNPCPANTRFADPAANPSWNGWGAGGANTRFQDQKSAGIAAADVPRLKLKWAFGFPGVKSVYGEPSVVAGRVYVGVDTGAVYSLDAATGCVYWTFQAESGVRSAVTIERAGAKYAAYFGDGKANVYAVDAATGQQIWKVHVEDHASARITGAPKVFEGRVYVPVASGEEGAGPNRNYPCCTFRGSVVALDAATGKQVW
jgi:polyvinyl alcohol dehydrogenase (cytochrome)